MRGVRTISNLLDKWVWRNPLPQGNHYHYIFFASPNGKNTFFALANKTVATSFDGINWTAYTNLANVPNKAIYAGGIFIGVYNSLIMTSINGINWIMLDIGISEYLYDLTYGNGVFAAVGSNGTIVRSLDGLHWIVLPSPVNTDLTGVVYGEHSGHKTFVAVGTDCVILYSQDDGLVWNKNINHHMYRNYGFTGVSFVNNAFIAFALKQDVIESGGYLFTSELGFLDWGDVVIAEQPQYIVGGQGLAAAVRPVLDFVLTTVDGVNWDRRIVESGGINGAQLTALAFGNGLWIAVGNFGVIFTSEDGIEWIERTRWNPAGTRSILAYGNGKFAVLGVDTPTLRNYDVYISRDGASWSRVGLGDDIFFVSFAGGIFIAFAGENKVFTSIDGVTWEGPYFSNYTLAEVRWNQICWGNGLFVGVGWDGAILTSLDAITWMRSYWSDDLFWDIIYANNLFVLVGEDGVIMTSSDGIDWTAQTSGVFREPLYGIAYGNGHYVAAGGFGNPVISTSTDGITWTAKSLIPLYFFPKDIIFATNIFVIVGEDDGNLFTSIDGEIWSVSEVVTPLNCIAYGNNTFVALGNGILTSGASVLPEKLPQSGLITLPVEELIELPSYLPR